MIEFIPIGDFDMLILTMIYMVIWTLCLHVHNAENFNFEHNKRVVGLSSIRFHPSQYYAIHVEPVHTKYDFKANRLWEIMNLYCSPDCGWLWNDWNYLKRVWSNHEGWINRVKASLLSINWVNHFVYCIRWNNFGKITNKSTLISSVSLVFWKKECKISLPFQRDVKPSEYFF